MPKKINILLITCLLVFSFAASASAKFGIELRGGLALIDPTAYNTDFSSALVDVYTGNAPAYNPIPSDIKGSSLSQAMNGTMNLSLFFGDSFAIKLRGDCLYSDYADIISYEGVDVLYSQTVLTTAYFGGGLAYYFNLSPNLALYLSGDGGMYMNISSFYQIGSEAGSEAGAKLAAADYPLGTYVYDILESSFGGHAEAGFQVLFNEAVGMALFGGYRIGSIPIAFPDGGRISLKTSTGTTSVIKEGVFTATEIDISGPYFGLGFVFYLGADKLPGQEGAAPAAGEAAKISQYEKYGDQFFRKKNYKDALAYYKGAMKQSANNGLYKKMGMCYYYMQDMQNAYDNIKKYMDTNPNDPAMVKWIEALKAKLGM